MTDTNPPTPAPAVVGAAMAHSAPTGMEGIATSTVKNAATMRKVNKLLSVNIDDNLRDLIVYVDDAVPSFLRHSLQPPLEQPSSDDTSTTTTTPTGGALSARELRLALEDRVVQMHENFLKAFGALYETYDTTAHQVQRLQTRCEALNDVLQVRAEEAGEFCAAVATLRAERQLLHRREEAMAEFTKKYNFGPEEQRILSEGEIDASYLAVLERARAVHAQSQSLLLSREHQQNAAAVMESTYTAILKASERIAHFLLSSSSSTGNATRMNSASFSATSNSSSNSSKMALASLSADVPEVSNFALRCMNILHEENHTQWQRVLDEMARLRRASVLRRYYHLLSTGSAVTRTGSYRSGSSATSNNYTESAGDESRIGTRPLEASLNDPVYFFSSLFAWLHQTIAEESELFGLFVPQDETGAGVTPQSIAAEVRETGTSNEEEQTVSPTAVLVTRASLLDLTFSGLCKHIQQALDGVLQRLNRVVGSNVAPLALDSAGNRENTNNLMMTDKSYGPIRRGGNGGAMGPRGLTGGLTRLFVAARNRTLGISSTTPQSSVDPDKTSVPTTDETAKGNETDANNIDTGRTMGSTSVQDVSVVQRYGQVSTRAQQESCVAMTLRGPLYGVRVGFTLMQLFYYYGSATFPPLLGVRAALVTLLMQSGARALHEGLIQYTQLLSSHLLDSVIGAVHRVGLLRKLGAAYEMEHQPRRSLTGQSQNNTTNTTSVARVSGEAALVCREPSSSLSSSMLGRTGETEALTCETRQQQSARRFVLNFLFVHNNLIAEEGFITNSGSHDVKQGETSTIEGHSNGEGEKESVSVTTRQASTRAASVSAVPQPSSSSATSSSLTWTLTRRLAPSSSSSLVQQQSSMNAHSLRHPHSLSQQQQRAETLELVRMLRQLILPASPEVISLLQLLHQVLDEGQRQDEMLQALRAQQRQRIHRNTSSQQEANTQGATQGEEEDNNEEVDATWWQLKPLSLMLCDILLNYPTALKRQRALQRSLDEACQRVMKLNVFVPLAQLFARYETYMTRTTRLYYTHCTTTTSPGNEQKEAASGSLGGEGGNMNATEGEETLLSKVMTRVEKLMSALAADLCTAAAVHYFPSSYSTSEQSSATPVNEGNTSDTSRRQRGLFHELYNLYNMIASQGRLPSFPLLDSVQDDTVRAELQKRTTNYLVNELYPRLYDEVSTASTTTAKFTEEERMTLADMAPNKLRILMDDVA